MIPFGKKAYFSKDVNNQQLPESLCFAEQTEKKTFTGAGSKTITRERFITVVSILSIIYIRAVTNDYRII